MARREQWESEDRWWQYHPSRPLTARGGIKARSQRGEFAGSWWGKRWLSVLESFGLGARLSRGRSYARSGQVLNLEIKPGVVAATVQGSRADPYKVSISLKAIEPKQREALGRAFAADMSIAARLIDGQLPPEAEQCFERAGSPLFPHRSRDLVTGCTCPDSSNPCKHIAAVYYILAEEFDRDPFLLLTLRGLGRDEFIALLSAAPGVSAGEVVGAGPALEPHPLGADPQSFWRGGGAMEPGYGDAGQAESGAPLARRLGPFPLWRGNVDFLEHIGCLSAAAAKHTLFILTEKEE